jgi:hypothetical protein
VSDEKVYCKGCRYLESELEHNSYYVHWCHAEFVKEDNYYGKTLYPRQAEKANRHNDCKYRKQKPWWMFWRG